MIATKQGFARGGIAMLMSSSALMLAMPAFGQEASTGQAQAGEAEQGGIQDIVVTARKRTETTQQVPVSVTAISAETLNRYDLTSLERVSVATPSFSIGRAPSGAGATLVMRGIGSNSTSIGLEQSVAVIVDGAYYGQGRTINEGFFDLGRLEILKGPQALFFGKNATAGVVSITTADPGDRLEVIARAGYEFKARQIVGEAIVSAPLSETLGVRIAVRGTKSDRGYFKQLGTTQIYPTTDRTSTSQVVAPTNHLVDPAGDGRGKEFYVRGTVKWQPTSDFSATLKANYGDNRNNNPGAGAVLYNCPTGKSAGNPAIPCARTFQSSANKFPAAIAAVTPYANRDGSLGNQYNSWAINAALEYQLDNVMINSVTNYNWNRNVFQLDGDVVSRSGPAGVNATEWSTFHAFSEELRATTSFDGVFNGMVGGYYQKTKRNYLAWTASGGLENSQAPQPFQRYLANSKDSQTEGETFAAFGQAIIKPTDQIEVTGGVRYTHETKNSYFLQPYSHPIRVTQGIFLPGVKIRSDLTFDDWSPEATISFKPTPDINIYAGYRTAYKSGGFSNSGILSPNASLADFEFSPEKAKGFEAGIKTLLLDRQLKLNLSAYHFKYTNLQLDFLRSDIFAFTTINAGSATSKGVELEMEFAPRAIDGLNLHAIVNYNKARYGDAPLAPCYAGQTRTAGCNLVYVNDGSANGTSRPFNSATDTIANRQNLKGLPTANAPEWTATFGFNYEAGISSGMKVGLSSDARYSSSYIASAFGTPASRQNSYLTVDGTIRLSSEDDRWQVALIGKNLTNKFFAVGGIDAPNTGSGTGTLAGVLADQVGYAGLPRTVMLQATFKY